MLDQALLEVGFLYESGELTLGFSQAQCTRGGAQSDREPEERAGLGGVWTEQAEGESAGINSGVELGATLWRS